MGLSTPFYGGGYPFFLGTISADRPLPFTVNLDGVNYPIELPEYRRNGQQTLRDGIISSGQPDDNLFNSEGAWWRYAASWHRGAGADTHDLGERADPFRFASSVGMDVWDDFRACLLPSTSLLLAEAATTIYMVATGGFLYVGGGTTLQRTPDLSSWGTVTGLTGTIQSLATDGTDVYVATTTHIYRVTPAGLASVVVTLVSDDYQTVHFTSNRLLGGADNVLREIASGGAATDIYTHFQPSFRWTTIFSVGSRIYVGGYAGNRSELYSLTTDSSGALVRSAEAAPFAFGETLQSALSYGGSVVLVTNIGVRFAALSGDGSLTYGPLITAPGDVRCATAEGRFVWFGWSNHAAGRGVGRLALDEFIDAYQPAYASDVYDSGAAATVTAVARFANRTLFAVSGVGIYQTVPNTYVTEGSITSGDVYFGTVERKATTSIFAGVTPLAAGQSLEVEVFDQDAASIGSGSTAAVGARGVTVDLDGTEMDAATVVTTLTGPGTSTPCLLRWRLRAFPIAPAVEEWIVPLIIHGQVIVNDGAGQLQSFDTLAEVERLIDRWRSKTVVAYREGARTYRVRIDDYEMRTREWSDDSDFFETLLIVKLVSV